MLARPNLGHLSIFAAVARLGSFRLAAVEHAVSVSAVSHAIRALEERLGVTLLNRTTRSVSLTDAGARLLERVQPALALLGGAVEEMNDFHASPTGMLRINTSRAAAHLVLAPLVTRFLDQHSGVHVEIVDEDSLGDVVAAGFDAGVRFMSSIPQDMVGVRISSPKRWAAVAAPGYFASRSRPETPLDLLPHDCVRFRFPNGRLFHWEFEKAGERFDIDVKGRLTLGDQSLMIKAALDGAGIAFIFDEFVEEHLATGRLERVLADWCHAFPGFMLYYPRQRATSSALRAFVDMAAWRDRGSSAD
ncbi:DNA-binding transcriptional LysR family regulator [Methylopila capsulata]|uniref:DNA-binding transcriptional LysR family regulator n=1 Tax=Methylopila capsulata TaxID=61654 RepID=A0A9W6IWS8_9HYPH|nr:LysR family transcriptional regulator [Methylopila capsulata]MBM7852386.1 DNA-binding transcriptional LysR family regulator [Methylopila capsulata]GLK56595.1 LysR family transcriptional regulator [Methylopila capsulata]